MPLPPFIRRIFRVTDFRPDPHRTLSEEIGFYLEERTRELEQQGHDPGTARRMAVQAFGDREEIEVTCDRIERTDLRQHRRTLMLDSLRRDARFALRSLRRQPLFSGLIIHMLALGIAGNTAVFSIINTLFLRPLPWDESDRLMNLDMTAPAWHLERVGLASADYAVWREESPAFEAMGLYTGFSMSLVGEEGAERVSGLTATWDLLETLRLVPVIGRTFTPEDGMEGGPQVVLLINAFWQERWGGDPAVLGRSLTLNGEPYEIVGVLPDEAVLGDEGDIFLPLQADPDDRGRFYLSGIGRLADGVSPEQAEADLRRVQQGLVEAGLASEEAMPIVTDLRETALGDMRTALFSVWGAITMLLLIACANVASLTLTRTVTRRRELGVRAALGAGQGTLARQILTENLVLALAGGVLGFLLGSAGITLIAGLIPVDLPPWMRFEADVGVQVFTLGVCAVVAVLVSVFPIVRISGRNRIDFLRESTSRTGTGRGTRRLLQGLVTIEVALALGLLATAALLGQTLHNLKRVDPGFDPAGVLAFRIDLPEMEYPGREDRTAFLATLTEHLEALPGVQAAAAASSLPMRGHSGYFFQVEGAEPLSEGQSYPVTLLRFVSPHYAEAAGIHLLAGRWLQPGDRLQVVANETFARYYWGDENPIGKRCAMTHAPDTLFEVVGLTRDVKHYGLDRDMRPGLYTTIDLHSGTGVNVIVRTGGEPAALVPAIRDVVADLDPNMPVFAVSTMAEIVAESLSMRRATSLLLGVFAAVSLLLALGGVYGVISYAVSTRRREIGIRIALGAGRDTVVRMVLGQGLGMVGLGLGAGMVLTLLLSRILTSLMFGISANDIGTLIVMTVVFLAVALVANLVPALRASRTDPVATLRIE